MYYFSLKLNYTGFSNSCDLLFDIISFFILYLLLNYEYLIKLSYQYGYYVYLPNNIDYVPNTI